MENDYKKIRAMSVEDIIEILFDEFEQVRVKIEYIENIVLILAEMSKN